MKLSSLKGAILFSAVFAGQAYAQTPSQTADILAETNQQALTELAQRFSNENKSNKRSLDARASQEGIALKERLANGAITELQEILLDGTPLYYQTYNANAAVSTRTNHLYNGGSLGLDLMGQNMIARVWDGGHARASHQEYDGPGGDNRYTVEDAVTEGGVQLNFHAAHVTGTVMASGVQAEAKGMAPESTVRGFMWNDDQAEAASEAANGMLISNHSYGFRGDLVPDQYFGAYINKSRDWDEIMYNAPFYLMVAAAGNDGNNNQFNGAPLQGNPSFDKLTGQQTSKNSLVVANGQDASIDASGALLNVAINSSSNQGPTDDFRIKPDITGNGTNVYSTYQNSNTAYNSISGTSMASPNVMGSMVLLQQHYNDVTGAFAKAATLKGLVLHTADDAGIEGPDAVFGWGLMNAKRAAQVITANGTTTTISELTLAQGESYTIEVDLATANALKASISWTDAPGQATTATNDNTPILVDDLDIRVSQAGQEFLPWRLTGVNSNEKGDNLVDPFERVDVSDASGIYTITVTHKGTLSAGSQNFSLVITTSTEEVPVIEPCVAEVTSFPYSQGFNNTLGQWEQSTTDDFNWTVRSGGTPSNGTGPSGAIEGSHYIYMEVSNPNYGSKSAILNSPCFDFTELTEAAATFSYQMMGNAVGTIALEVSTDNGVNWTQVWSKSGDQGSDWQEATVNLDSYIGATVKLRFAGRSGNSWQGDIAIDDFGISEGIFVDTEAPSAPLNLTASNVTDTTVDLSWDEATDNVGVTGYDIYRDGVLLNSTSATTFDVTGLSSETTYTFVVTAKDEEGNTSTDSNEVIVITEETVVDNTPPTGYCSSNGNTTADEYISRVQIGTIDNVSGASPGGYEDFTNISTVLNATNDITITPEWTGRKYREAYAVFIDWNRDGDFSDNGERVFTRNRTDSSPISGSFDVPAGAGLGATRMRVSMKYNALPSSCETFDYGEVEDYVVFVDPTISFQTNQENALLSTQGNNIEINFSVYPNPAREQLNINIDTSADSYSIYNLLGQMVARGEFQSSIQVASLRKGVYILEIIAGEQIQRKRFIKK